MLYQKRFLTNKEALCEVYFKRNRNLAICFLININRCMTFEGAQKAYYPLNIFLSTYFNLLSRQLECLCSV